MILFFIPSLGEKHKIVDIDSGDQEVKIDETVMANGILLFAVSFHRSLFSFDIVLEYYPVWFKLLLLFIYHMLD